MKQAVKNRLMIYGLILVAFIAIISYSVISIINETTATYFSTGSTGLKYGSDVAKALDARTAVIGVINSLEKHGAWPISGVTSSTDRGNPFAPNQP